MQTVFLILLHLYLQGPAFQTHDVKQRNLLRQIMLALGGMKQELPSLFALASPPSAFSPCSGMGLYADPRMYACHLQVEALEDEVNELKSELRRMQQSAFLQQLPTSPSIATPPYQQLPPDMQCRLSPHSFEVGSGVQQQAAQLHRFSGDLDRLCGQLLSTRESAQRLEASPVMQSFSGSWAAGVYAATAAAAAAPPPLPPVPLSAALKHCLLGWLQRCVWAAPVLLSRRYDQLDGLVAGEAACHPPAVRDAAAVLRHLFASSWHGALQQAPTGCGEEECAAVPCGHKATTQHRDDPHGL